ncbi:hypothetical protein Q1695_012023 [Nippostrongylus brasiliensis]|nr:hypothetical protein Q1695_012023 [Nippostrongylus brasiliensis]
MTAKVGQEDVEITTDPKHERRSDPKTPWVSIYIAGACAFVQSAQYTTFLSSMWPYLRELNPAAVETEYGYVLAVYSIGQCVAAPSFGYWSNRIEQVRLPLLVGFLLMAMGNSLYLFLQFLPPSSVAIGMMITRLVAGGGTGNVTLLRAYASTSSSTKDRARAIACVSGGIAIGTLIGPAFQLVFTPLGTEGIHVLPFYKLNIYNAPALFSLLLNAAGFLGIFFAFKEKYDVLDAEASKGRSELPPPCMIAVMICVFTRFVQMSASITVGTLGSAFSMLMFSFNKEETVAVNAASYVASGIVGVTIYFAFIFFNLSKCVPPRISTIISMAAFAGLFVLTLPWPFLPNKVKISSNGSDWGCYADRFDWCDNLTEVSPWVYYASSVVIFGVASSILNIATTTLYSEVIGPRRQGTLQGVYQMAGSFGRMLTPLLASFLYTKYGPTAPWLSAILQIALVVCLWIGFRKKLVPLKVPSIGSPRPKDSQPS